MIHQQIDYKDVLHCPKCKGPVNAIEGRYGWFWSCKKYPRCNGTLSMKRAEDEIKRYLNVDWDDWDPMIDEQPF